ncbi:MAG: extracellular solute-binding protein [Aggregatilineales bacterium]
MLKRSVLGFASLSAALTLAVIALSANPAGAQTAPTNTPAPTATTVVVDTGSGATKLNYWNGLTGGDGDVMQSLVANFAKANPDISVHTEEYVWDTMFQKLQASFVAGNPPDVFVLHISELPQFASLGILAASDDLYDTNGGPIPAKDFGADQLAATVVDGKHYGVLFDNHGFGTWVNLNLFKSAGVDANTAYPKTADEFVKLATSLTLDKNGKHPNDAGFDANNIVQYGTGIDWARVQFESFLDQFGGSVISADGKKATVNSDAGQKALQFMYDMIYKYHIAPDPSKVNGYNAFQAGQIAIMPSGTWFRNVLVVQHPEIKWEAWPMIQVGPNPGTWMNSHMLFIASSLTGPKLDAAKKFIVWLSGHSDQWAAAGHVPARISMQKQLDPKTYSSNIVFGQGFLSSGHFEPQNVNITELTNAYDPEITAALNGQKSVKQALDDGAAAMQAVIDRGS